MWLAPKVMWSPPLIIVPTVRKGMVKILVKISRDVWIPEAYKQRVRKTLFTNVKGSLVKPAKVKKNYSWKLLSMFDKSKIKAKKTWDLEEEEIEETKEDNDDEDWITERKLQIIGDSNLELTFLKLLMVWT
jgi:hypothetical protein